VLKKQKQNIYCGYFVLSLDNKTHLSLETNSTRL